MDPSDRARAPRPYISVLFECCSVYLRVYRAPGAQHYFGRCPRCLRAFKVEVGPAGVPSRQLRAR